MGAEGTKHDLWLNRINTWIEIMAASSPPLLEPTRTEVRDGAAQPRRRRGSFTGFWINYEHAHCFIAKKQPDLLEDLNGKKINVKARTISIFELTSRRFGDIASAKKRGAKFPTSGGHDGYSESESASGPA